jgi:sodium/potassium-transporting ATPase subunit alpha
VCDAIHLHVLLCSVLCLCLSVSVSVSVCLSVCLSECFCLVRLSAPLTRYQGWLLIYDYYGIAGSWLSGSTNTYFVDDAPPLRIPSGCNAGPGCTIYDEAAQKDIMLEAAGAYWWMLVMAQVIHIFMCKTRRLSLRTHGLWNNTVMIYGVSLEIALILIFIFIPRVNSLLVGLPFPSQFWPMFLAPWAAIVIFNEGRKYLGQRNPNGFVNKYINW